ncbi:MAG TPA: ABC transporter permease [Armatimonadota bacterium]|jgi:ribose transport system permease protein
MGKLRETLRQRETGILLAVLVILVGMAFHPSRGSFYGPDNLQNLLRQIAFLGIFALGEAIVIITGGIDLSVSSVIAFSGMVSAASFADAHWGFGASLGAGLAASLVVGVLHALLIGWVGIPPFVATLGTLSILRSVVQLMNNNMPIPVYGPGLDSRGFLFLEQGKLFSVAHPAGGSVAIGLPFALFVALAVAMALLMRGTSAGRNLYAVGGNEEATRLSGVSLLKTKALAYCLSSVLAGVAGILYLAYQTQGDARTGMGYELNAIAAAVVGGCSLSGGQGTILGVVLGDCLLNLLLTAMPFVISEKSTQWEGTIVGSVVLLAVVLNTLRQRRTDRQ